MSRSMEFLHYFHRDPLRVHGLCNRKTLKPGRKVANMYDGGVNIRRTLYVSVNVLREVDIFRQTGVLTDLGRSCFFLNLVCNVNTP